jgi:hypothetical protein
MKEVSDRPPDSDFHQQNLKAWQPLLTPGWVIATFFVIGIIFVPIGVVILQASNGVKEFSKRYDQMANPALVSLNITEDMAGPVYFYYQLTNFYQNHRRYVKSRSDPQLRGEDVLEADLVSKCDPLVRSSLDGNKLLYPCGLIANSYFTDKFASPTLETTTGIVNISWTESGIAWESDKTQKFKNFSNFNPATMTTVGPQNVSLNHMAEDFIVWMRTAGLPTFKKLRFIIPGGVKKGMFRVQISNVFEVGAFDGQKAVVLSTISWLGGKNPFLGYAYIVVGALCLLLALAFGVKHKVSPRKLGDMRYFNWHGPARVESNQA